MKTIYMYGFFSVLSLDQFLYFIFLYSIDFSLYEIGIGYALYQVTQVITDIPFSYLADRFGRKKFLIAGAILNIASIIFLLLLMNGNILFYLIISSILQGLAITIISNVDDAYLHDYVTTKTNLTYEKVLSSFTAMTNFALLVGALAGGLLSTMYSFKVLYYTELLIGVITLIITFFLPTIAESKPSIKEPVNDFKTALQVEMKSFFMVWKKVPNVFIILLIGSSIYWTMSSLVVQLSEPYFSEIGMNNLVITIIFTIAYLFAIIGNKLAGKSRNLNRSIVMTPLIVAIALFLFYVSTTPSMAVLAIIGLFIQKLVSGFNEVTLDGKIIRLAPTNFKSTTMSMMETGIALMLAIMFPLLGLIQSYLGYNTLFLVMAFLFIALSIGSFVWVKRIDVDKELIKMESKNEG